jgi:hypothetical protein
MGPIEVWTLEPDAGNADVGNFFTHRVFPGAFSFAPGEGERRKENEKQKTSCHG